MICKFFSFVLLLAAFSVHAANTSMCVVGPNVCLTDSRYQMGSPCLCSKGSHLILKGTIMSVNVSSVCKVTGRDQKCLTGTISEIGTPCICDTWVGYVVAD